MKYYQYHSFTHSYIFFHFFIFSLQRRLVLTVLLTGPFTSNGAIYWAWVQPAGEMLSMHAKCMLIKIPVFCYIILHQTSIYSYYLTQLFSSLPYKSRLKGDLTSVRSRSHMKWLWRLARKQPFWIGKGTNHVHLDFTKNF